MISTRRDILILALVGTLAEAADPWKDKRASDWSEKDIEKLLDHSPWVKEATVSFSMAEAGGAPGGMPGGGRPGGPGGPPGGGMGGPPGGGGMGGPGEGGMPALQAIVRWESAAPIRVARKAAALPANQYVISVTGLPMAPRGNGNQPDRPELLGRVAAMTDLERKGKESIPCSRVEMSRGEDSNRVIYYFDPGSTPISPQDKEVTFNTKMGPVQVRAKFTLKEMTFEGKLAL